MKTDKNKRKRQPNAPVNNKNIRMQIVLPESLKNELYAKSKSSGISATYLVVDAIRSAMNGTQAAR